MLSLKTGLVFKEWLVRSSRVEETRPVSLRQNNPMTHPIDTKRPLTNLAEATAEWVTAVLKDGGYLNQGSVIAITTNGQDSQNATNGRLTLSYTDHTRSDAPRHLFIKICKNTNDFGDSELIYYTEIAPKIPNAPQPICYHAAHDKQNGHYHLLLEDLSDTHEENWPIPPSETHSPPVIDALAQLHASWWNHPSLPQVGNLPTPEQIELYTTFPAKGEAYLLETMKDTLSKQEIEMVQTIFAKLPQALQKRARGSQTFTIIHGDMNPGNILSPKQENGRVYLIDRQLFSWNLSIWLSVSDITNMIIHWWSPQIRRELERPLLQRYHQQITQLGVTDYSFDELWQDYRLCAMQSLYIVGAWCADPIERTEFAWVWQPQLQKILQACQDLNTIELLTD